MSEGIPDHLAAAVGLTWKRLNDEQKTAVHLTATSPPDYLVPEAHREACGGLVDKAGRLDESIATEIETLAGIWHRKAGRI